MQMGVGCASRWVPEMNTNQHQLLVLSKGFEQFIYTTL